MEEIIYFYSYAIWDKRNHGNIKAFMKSKYSTFISMVKKAYVIETKAIATTLFYTCVGDKEVGLPYGDTRICMSCQIYGPYIVAYGLFWNWGGGPGGMEDSRPFISQVGYSVIYMMGKDVLTRAISVARSFVARI